MVTFDGSTAARDHSQPSTALGLPLPGETWTQEQVQVGRRVPGPTDLVSTPQQ